MTEYKFIIHHHKDPRNTQSHYDLRMEDPKDENMLMQFALPENWKELLDSTNRTMIVRTKQHKERWLDLQSRRMDTYDTGTVLYDKLFGKYIELEFKGQKLSGKFRIFKLKDKGRKDLWILVKSVDKKQLTESSGTPNLVATSEPESKLRYILTEFSKLGFTNKVFDTVKWLEGKEINLLNICKVLAYYTVPWCLQNLDYVTKVKIQDSPYIGQDAKMKVRILKKMNVLINNNLLKDAEQTENVNSQIIKDIIGKCTIPITRTLEAVQPK